MIDTKIHERNYTQEQGIEYTSQTNNWGSALLLTDGTGLHSCSVKPKAECEEKRRTEGLGAGVTKTEEQAQVKKSRRGAGWLKNQ
jgi:hypothetical protein